ncbi:ATP-binding cassette domain-containing protein [Clostridium senegalense]
MEETILATRNLTKRYKNNIVVNNVNMNIKKGDIYGLIGKNGAGKTTIIRLILSLIDETDGEIELFSKTSTKEKLKELSRVGSIVETPKFYPYFTAEQNLEYYRIQRGIVEKEIVKESLELVGLKDVGNKKFKKFSLGMKQRLGIALAIMGDPDFLVLDEPTNGLDPMGIVEIREILLKLNKLKNTTILISSHILGEVAQLATCFGFIDNGMLIEEISAKEMNEKCRTCLAIKVNDIEKTSAILENKVGCKEYEVLPDNNIKIYAHLDEPEIINKLLVENGVMVYSLERLGANLENYFIDLVGGKAHV